MDGEGGTISVGSPGDIQRPLAFLLDGQRHMGHRRLLLPAFHGRRLRRQASAMRARAEACFDAWPQGEVASLPRMRELTLDVVMHAVFGDPVALVPRGAAAARSGLAGSQG